MVLGALLETSWGLLANTVEPLMVAHGEEFAWSFVWLFQVAVEPFTMAHDEGFARCLGSVSDLPRPTAWTPLRWPMVRNPFGAVENNGPTSISSGWD